MLSCSLMQAAVTSWIESLKHRAKDICIDYSYIPCNSCISTRECQNCLIFKLETRFYFRKKDANACEAQEGKVVCSIFSRLSCVAVAHNLLYLTLACQ